MAEKGPNIKMPKCVITLLAAFCIFQRGDRTENIWHPVKSLRTKFLFVVSCIEENI